jgi:protein-arginine kinase activator protein McsA
VQKLIAKYNIIRDREADIARRIEQEQKIEEKWSLKVPGSDHKINNFKEEIIKLNEKLQDSQRLEASSAREQLETAQSSIFTSKKRTRDFRSI